MSGTRVLCQADQPRFRVGQRVQREFFDDESARMAREPRRRAGVVVDVYAVINSAHGDYPELYDVQWDGEDGRSRAYLPHGIEEERDQKEVAF